MNAIIKSPMAKVIFLMHVALISHSMGQPTPAPSTPDAPCGKEPAGEALNETASSVPDSQGYYSLFDGASFKGWWQSCETGHSSSNTSEGAIMRVAPDQKAMYMTQRGNAGGILMTKKKYDHYELVFDIWPDFKNDAGIFHRTPANGKCFQTVLDYINSASLGGTWGEAGWISRDIRPFVFNGAEDDITIPGKGSDWTEITKGLNPTSYGCAATGCVGADWKRLWDMNGWNQIKIQFYGGITSATANHMKSWFRKSGETVWVPVLQDTTLVKANPAGFIGIQVHGGGRFSGPKGNWYRNIKLKPLTENGLPLEVVGCKDPGNPRYNPAATVNVPEMCAAASNANWGLDATSGRFRFGADKPSLIVSAPGEYRVRLLDSKGAVKDRLAAHGPFSYTANRAGLRSGVYFLRLESGGRSLEHKYNLR